MGEWELEIQFPFEGVPKGRPRLGRGNRVFTPKKTAIFEQMIVSHIYRYVFPNPKIPHFGSLLKVEIEFHFKKKKTSKLERPVPDCDNLTKAVLDAGNTLLWADDADIVSVKASKQFSSSGKIILRVGYA